MTSKSVKKRRVRRISNRRTKVRNVLKKSKRKYILRSKKRNTLRSKKTRIVPIFKLESQCQYISRISLTLSENAAQGTLKDKNKKL